MVTQPKSSWALLSYRIPREPSTPRIAVWRKLRELGVAQVGDGLVALPADARTIEHLEWVAASVIEADGDAIVWVAAPTTRRGGSELANQMSSARTSEYRELLDEMISITGRVDSRSLARLRRSWRKIDRRDYFRSELRDESRIALADLARDGAHIDSTESVK
ncbi:MAG: Chromate resistance protein ChrB [Acidimicrobiales bacterium]